MTYKIVSTIFVLVILLTTIEQTYSGPVISICCYWTCMGLCTTGAGIFAGVMTGGVATPAGMVYGAAACSVSCASLGAACAALPTP